MVLGTTVRDPLRTLAFATAVLYAAGSGVFTLLADLQEKAGFSDFGLGLVAFGFFGAALAVQLTVARLADTGEARKMLLAGVFLSVVGLLWFAVADSLGEMVAARTVGGLGVGLFEPAARAAVCAGHREAAGRRLGVITSAQTSGLVIGPLVTAGIFEATGSLAWPFLVMAGAVLATVPVLVRIPLAETDEPTAAGPTALQLFRRPAVRRSVLVTVALLAPVGMYEVVWAPLVKDRGGSTLLIGISVALYGIPYLIAAPIGGALGDRVGAERVARIGGAAVVVVILVVGTVPSVTAIIALGVIEACCNAAAIPNAYAAVSRATGPDEQATGQGLAGGASMACIAVMTLVSGAVYGWGGQLAAFWFAAAVTATFLLLAHFTREPTGDDAGPSEATVQPLAVVPPVVPR